MDMKGKLSEMAELLIGALQLCMSLDITDNISQPSLNSSVFLFDLAHRNGITNLDIAVNTVVLSINNRRI